MGKRCAHHVLNACVILIRSSVSHFIPRSDGVLLNEIIPPIRQAIFDKLASTFSRNCVEVALILLGDEASELILQFTDSEASIFRKDALLLECLQKWYSKNPSASGLDLYGSLLAAGCNEDIVRQFDFLLQVRICQATTVSCLILLICLK